MFLSLENTLINLDSITRIDYIKPKNNPAYIQITYKTGTIESIKKLKWEEFQFIRQELLRKDCIIPIEGEANNDDTN